MDVSVIIVNYNTFQLTCNCIASVYSQTTNLDFEIILVDNASSECDPSLFKDKFPGIILIKNKTNVGFAKGNNIGIEAASAPLILLLNSDTILQNNAIESARDALLKKGTLGAVTVKLQFADGRIQKQCERLPSVFLTLFEKSRLHKFLPLSLRGKIFLGAYFDHLHYIEPETIWGTFFMIPKKIITLMPEKKLNDDYFMYFEDTQWCLDIMRAGYKIGYEPAGLVTHLMGQSDAPKKELMIKNKALFFEKNYSKFKILCLKQFGYFK